MYGTAAQFVEAFGEPETVMLTNLDTPMATAIDPVPLERDLIDAAALIDSYIGRRYLLPLTVTPGVLIPYSLDIARYRLDRIRNREDVRVRYEDAIKWLESIACGKCALMGLGADALTNQPVNPTSGVGSISYGSAGSIDLVGF
jgi:phage gp36-like protein